MTTTIEDGFGSRLMTEGGFLLNNELTDFSFVPVDDGKPVANRVEPGKRPRSAMAPTIVYDRHGRVAIVAGSPGGSAIIDYVVKTLLAIIDWKLDPQAAIGAAELRQPQRPDRAREGHGGRSARAEACSARPRHAHHRPDQRRAGDRAHAARLDRRRGPAARRCRAR